MVFLYLVAVIFTKFDHCLKESVGVESDCHDMSFICFSFKSVFLRPDDYEEILGIIPALYALRLWKELNITIYRIPYSFRR